MAKIKTPAASVEPAKQQESNDKEVATIAKPAVQQKPVAELTLNDIKNVLVIIDTVSQRGAFKASEMEVVGNLYNKFSAFIQSKEVPPQEQK